MKKQMAIVMAAATVVTAVSPMLVDASVVYSKDTVAVNNLKQKIKEYMRIRYSENKNMLRDETLADKPVYEVRVELRDDDDYSGDKTPDATVSYTTFERDFDKMYQDLDEGASIKITTRSKDAVRMIDDVTATDAKEGDDYERTNDGGIRIGDGNDLNASTSDEDLEVGEIYKDRESDGNYSYQIKLSDYRGNTARMLDINVGDKALDTEKPILKIVEGFYVDKDGDSIIEAKNDDKVSLSGGTISIEREDGDSIDSSRANDAVVDGFLPMLGGEAESKTMYDVVENKTEIREIDADDFYDVNTGRLTQKANDLLIKLNQDYDLKGVEDDDENNDTLVYVDDSDSSKEMAKVKIIRSSSDDNGEAYRAVVTEGNLENMATLKTESSNDKNYVVQAAGSDRYVTSVQVANVLIGDKDQEVDTVVLVSGDSKSMVDGLTAAPLAHSLGDDVPVLLTMKDELPQAVKDFLRDRDVSKVKIVGGENGVSKKVVSELKSDLVISDVERFSGDDRYETAMEVADEIKDEKGVSNVYLVGGYATPDSLSVAGIAAKEDAPILLTPKNSLPGDVKNFIETNDDDKVIDVIGGKNSVSDAVVRKLLSDVKGKSVNRVSGVNRQETNAEVIKELGGNSNDEYSNVVIARGDGRAIVDALSAGVYAAKDDYALLLTGSNGLIRAQKDLVKQDDLEKILQVGYAVNSSDAGYLFKEIPTENQADGK